MHAPLRDMACQCAGGTHPTGMHSCFIITKSSGTIDQIIPCRPSPSTLRLALLSETLVKFMSNFDIVHVRKQHKVTFFPLINLQRPIRMVRFLCLQLRFIYMRFYEIVHMVRWLWMKFALYILELHIAITQNGNRTHSCVTSHT